MDARTAQIALIDSQLGDTVAVSPVDGVVLVKSADVGEVLAPGTTVVTVGDIDHPWLRGYINETDLGTVKTRLARSTSRPIRIPARSTTGRSPSSPPRPSSRPSRSRRSRSA